MKKIIRIWSLMTILLLVEYFLAYKFPNESIFHRYHSPGPSKSLSYYLGWIGFILMIAMNMYTIKKRTNYLKYHKPNLSQWFNFHIFCGLAGPTFIIFHANGKAHGLIAVGFYSMLISLFSGLIGRYILQQLSYTKKIYESRSNKYLLILNRRFKDKESENLYLIESIHNSYKYKNNLMLILIKTILNDIKLIKFQYSKNKKYFPLERFLISLHLKNYRKHQTIEQFKRILSYWHSYHLPFAIMMYLISVIHVITVLIIK